MVNLTDYSDLTPIDKSQTFPVTTEPNSLHKVIPMRREKTHEYFSLFRICQVLRQVLVSLKSSDYISLGWRCFSETQMNLNYPNTHFLGATEKWFRFT